MHLQKEKENIPLKVVELSQVTERRGFEKFANRIFL